MSERKPQQPEADPKEAFERAKGDFSAAIKALEGFLRSRLPSKDDALSPGDLAEFNALKKRIQDLRLLVESKDSAPLPEEQVEFDALKERIQNSHVQPF